MSTNEINWGSNISSNGFIVTQLSGLDIPIYNDKNQQASPDYLLYDENEVITGGMTISEHATAHPNRRIKYSTDGLVAYYGMMIPFSKDGLKSLTKTFANYGLVVSKDFTTMNDKDYWICSYYELIEWLDVSPHMDAVEII